MRHPYGHGRAETFSGSSRSSPRSPPPPIRGSGRRPIRTGTVSAVKELKTHRLEAEPYRRFRDEVAFHTACPYRGVLPVLAAHVPASPSGEDPAWLAMRWPRRSSSARYQPDARPGRRRAPGIRGHLDPPRRSQCSPSRSETRQPLPPRWPVGGRGLRVGDLARQADPDRARPENSGRRTSSRPRWSNIPPAPTPVPRRVGARQRSCGRLPPGRTTRRPDSCASAIGQLSFATTTAIRAPVG